jgi:class 3 adenylate cyclase
VLVTGALIDALSAESSDGLTGEFSDQGHHVLRGHTEPIHLFGVIRSVV